MSTGFQITRRQALKLALDDRFISLPPVSGQADRGAS
jgi:hypothetical protein